MPRFLAVSLIAMSLSAAGAVSVAAAQVDAQYREVYGNVRDHHGSPLKGANVQMENSDTHSVQSYLTDADGAFHFRRLSKDTDYEVFASFNGASSKKSSISKFDDKPSKLVKLVIEVR